LEEILVVDDDRNLCKVLKAFLEEAGYEALAAHDVEAALEIIEGHNLGLVVTDLKMPGRSGMDLLAQCKERRPAMPVIIITAHGDIGAAVSAMKCGAHDFITKPFDEKELLNAVGKAMSESRKNRELVSDFFDKGAVSLPMLVGRSAALGQVLETVERVAPSDVTVLVTGETGVGKELVAKAVHMASPRRDHPLIKVNCAAIPETLLESELFGYEKGAFTGAASAKPGRFELADRGTLLLDEIGDMPLHLQSKLLSVLQDRAFERVGGVKTIRVDVRVIAATHRDLSALVGEGLFRADLYYRLNAIPIHIPPLRERAEDVAVLSEHLLEKFRTKYRRQANLLPEAASALVQYGWPGNVRELENILERMVLMSGTGQLGIEDVPGEIRGHWPDAAASTLKEKKEILGRTEERRLIIEALDKTDGNRTRAAKLLGISRRALQNKIKTYRI
jgi:DNA-binding NtrC family response regulator